MVPWGMVCATHGLSTHTWAFLLGVLSQEKDMLPSQVSVVATMGQYLCFGYGSECKQGMAFIYVLSLYLEKMESIEIKSVGSRARMSGFSGTTLCQGQVHLCACTVNGGVRGVGIRNGTLAGSFGQGMSQFLF